MSPGERVEVRFRTARSPEPLHDSAVSLSRRGMRTTTRSRARTASLTPCGFRPCTVGLTGLPRRSVGLALSGRLDDHDLAEARATTVACSDANSPALIVAVRCHPGPRAIAPEDPHPAVALPRQHLQDLAAAGALTRQQQHAVTRANPLDRRDRRSRDRPLGTAVVEQAQSLSASALHDRLHQAVRPGEPVATLESLEQAVSHQRLQQRAQPLGLPAVAAGPRENSARRQGGPPSPLQRIQHLFARDRHRSPRRGTVAVCRDIHPKAPAEGPDVEHPQRGFRPMRGEGRVHSSATLRSGVLQVGAPRWRSRVRRAAEPGAGAQSRAEQVGSAAGLTP